MQTPDGERIPIENRGPDEVRKMAGQSIAPEGVDVVNPVFDVTPAELVDVIVTERGVVEKPDRRGIAALFDH